jgi:formate-dependent phosphoribosylglycinamide formyltransferase (GAR transformylase)
MEKQVLLLTTVNSYRSSSFVAAAKRLGVGILPAFDTPPELASQPHHVDFTKVESATQQLLTYIADKTITAVLPVDDSGTLLAAKVSYALNLPFNNPQAAEAARNKLLMRQLLQAGHVPCPQFQHIPFSADPTVVGITIYYPCVVKPLQLSGSRGVIRANNVAEFVDAFQQTVTIAQKQSPQAPSFVLVEQYIDGSEVAVEGLIHEGQLRILAIFDKPDPLVGPFFEETIYVTPSRMPALIQSHIQSTTFRATQALGLYQGPVHAELRVNNDGAWLIEIAGRSIGGLCSQILQFGANESLEELILRQAVGLPIESFQREAVARGVMMIPIPQAGLLREIAGIPQATAIPLIEQIDITAPLHNPLVPLPAGDSYLGFIFARGEPHNTPADVEHALRQAHAQLTFKIDPIIELMPRV